MKIRFAVMLMIITLFFSGVISAQVAGENDKVTTVNIMISTIYSTNKGLIVEYYADGKFMECYLPHWFFDQRIVVKVLEDNPQISPQMNVVYKNGEPYKIKLYVPTVTNGWDYQVIEHLPDDKAKIFDSTKKLEVKLKADQSAAAKQ